MTEAEVLEVVAAYTANAHSSFTMYLSITFAYIITAYLAGSRLNTYQTLAASGLFVVGAVSTALGTLANIQAWTVVADSRLTVLEDVPLFAGGFWIASLSTLMFIGVFAALYFMWQIRQVDTER